MRVRIRLGRGISLAGRGRKNARISLVLSTFGTLAAISLGTFGIWRLGQDLGWAGDFVFPSGLLSHWQVWLSAAAALQYASWRLARYGRAAQEQQISRMQNEQQREGVRATVNS